jgi:Glycosyl hydrolases family 32 N-terminal domain
MKPCLKSMVTTLFFVPACAGWGAAPTMIPRVASEWWTVARDPDLGAYTATNQQPVDFSIWQAADGTWQLWSCIRNTRCGGVTRLFHGWEGRRLTDTDWAPRGITMEAKAELGEKPGGLQAPFVLRQEGRFLMFYGDWEHICMAGSNDGKVFTRRVNADGKTALFGEGAGDNARDPMVLFTRGAWHCYYTAHPNQQGAVYCRTSTDLRAWSAARKVAFGGIAGTNFASAECPFVVELTAGEYYLFRTQRYGAQALTRVYHSRDAMDFGVDSDDGHWVAALPLAAPEIFRHEQQWYIASLLPTLNGIRLAKLEWVKKNDSLNQ